MALVGLILIAIGIWQAVSDDAMAGGLLILVGLGLFFWAGGLFSRTEAGELNEVRELDEPTGDDTAEHVADAPETIVAATASATRDRFTVFQTGDDGYLDAVARLLRANPEIDTIVEESGRHYSVPDGDDLPEWFALRIYCKEDARPLDQIMDELNDEILEKLGKDALCELSVTRY